MNLQTILGCLCFIELEVYLCRFGGRDCHFEDGHHNLTSKPSIQLIIWESLQVIVSYNCAKFEKNW